LFFRPKNKTPLRNQKCHKLKTWILKKKKIDKERKMDYLSGFSSWCHSL
jgi:hypothetical protein